MKEVDLEISEIIGDLKIINISNDETNGTTEFIDENIDETQIEENEYDLSKENSSTFDDLIIELDDVNGHKIPRYSCACHKCNIAIRKAIKLCPGFAKDMSALKNYTKTIRKSNLKISIFKLEKCRMRCENATRWSSAFLTVFSVYKAYKRGIKMDGCPLSLEKIEFYLQILLPGYKFSIGFQRTKSSISEVLPSLLILFNTWRKLSQNPRYKTICGKLITCFEDKFSYELNSNSYLVAALLDTSKINIWYWKKYSEGYAAKAVDALINEASDLLGKEMPNPNPKKIQQKLADDVDDDLFDQLHRDDDDEDEVEANIGKSMIFNLRKEKELFFSLINKPKEEQKAVTTKMFWIENRKTLSSLYKLAQRLLTIPASSAFIERFFSVCGVVCKKRCGNMSDELIIMRSFLKCNIDILNSLKK
jgi:hypothetical protein